MGLPIIYSILRVVGEVRAEAHISTNIAKTKRTEIINDKKYTVTTKTLPLVRDKRSGRMGIIMERGAENDPNLVNGEMTMEPRWVSVQFIRKSDGKLGRAEWRKYSKLQTVGTATVDFLTYQAGFFRTESFIRYKTTF